MLRLYKENENPNLKFLSCYISKILIKLADKLPALLKQILCGLIQKLLIFVLASRDYL